MAKLTRFSELTTIPAADKWFQVYPLTHNIFAIFEPYHFQEVISFLIIGSERALLLDTGMGIGDMKATVAEILVKHTGTSSNTASSANPTGSALPVTVVNTHSHFDHTGGNWQFDEVHILNVPEAVEVLKSGYAIPDGDENLSLEAYSYPGELWFDYSKLKIRPCNPIPVEVGHIFDLGNRKFRVISTPGHSDDSLMLVDDENKIVFTGDTIYPAPLYAHLSSSNLEVYIDTVRKLVEEFSDYTLFCSHNNPVWEGSALAEIEKAFAEVKSKKEEAAAQGVSPEIQQYMFEDFSIIA